MGHYGTGDLEIAMNRLHAYGRDALALEGADPLGQAHDARLPSPNRCDAHRRCDRCARFRGGRGWRDRWRCRAVRMSASGEPSGPMKLRASHFGLPSFRRLWRRSGLCVPDLCRVGQCTPYWKALNNVMPILTNCMPSGECRYYTSSARSFHPPYRRGRRILFEPIADRGATVEYPETSRRPPGFDDATLLRSW